MRGHNAAQIQQVGKDGFAWISKCIAAKAALEMKIAACTEAEDVLQFVWVTPT
jgi:peroxiredoxin family protein